MAKSNRTKVTTDTADTLSLKLYNLTEIVKLAAFATEARRTLDSIHGAMQHRPELDAAIMRNVSCAKSWADMQDNTGEVLSYLSQELEEINSGFTEAVYGAIEQGETATEPA